MSCTGWNVLMDHVRPDDIVVIDRPDRFNRDFDAGVKVQGELTKRNVGIVALREGTNTADDSPAAKLFRRMVLVRGPTAWSPPANGSRQDWSGSASRREAQGGR